MTGSLFPDDPADRLTARGWKHAGKNATGEPLWRCPDHEGLLTQKDALARLEAAEISEQDVGD